MHAMIIGRSGNVGHLAETPGRCIWKALHASGFSGSHPLVLALRCQLVMRRSSDQSCNGSNVAHTTECSPTKGHASVVWSSLANSYYRQLD